MSISVTLISSGSTLQSKLDFLKTIWVTSLNLDDCFNVLCIQVVKVAFLFSGAQFPTDWATSRGKSALYGTSQTQCKNPAASVMTRRTQLACLSATQHKTSKLLNRLLKKKASMAHVLRAVLCAPGLRIALDRAQTFTVFQFCQLSQF